MIKNYLKTAWRNLYRNKIFSAINILGLSTGLACCILMFLFIQNELSYDKFNVNAKNIYRIVSIPMDAKDKKELAGAFRLPIQTRWLSNFYMVEAYFDHVDQIKEAVNSDGSVKIRLAYDKVIENTNFLSAYFEVIEIFKESIVEFQVRNFWQIEINSSILDI